MNKEVTVEACEEFIRSTFEKIAKACRCDIGKAGIEVGVFWDEAEKAGLWERGTYGTPMSDALSKLAKVEARLNKEGEWSYSVFMMKKGGEMRKGDFIHTPRYGIIRLQAVYESREEAMKAGYKEDTWYKDPAYGILGKDLGKDLMVFAAYRKRGEAHDVRDRQDRG